MEQKQYLETILEKVTPNFLSGLDKLSKDFMAGSKNPNYSPRWIGISLKTNFFEGSIIFDSSQVKYVSFSVNLKEVLTEDEILFVATSNSSDTYDFFREKKMQFLRENYLETLTLCGMK